MLYNGSKGIAQLRHANYRTPYNSVYPPVKMNCVFYGKLCRLNFYQPIPIINHFLFPLCIFIFQYRYHMSIPLLWTLTKKSRQLNNILYSHKFRWERSPNINQDLLLYLHVPSIANHSETAVKLLHST